MARRVPRPRLLSPAPVRPQELRPKFETPVKFSVGFAVFGQHYFCG